MSEELKIEIAKLLEKEANKIKKSCESEEKKSNDLCSILHILQILDKYEELEPVIQDYLNKSAIEEKFKEEER